MALLSAWLPVLLLLALTFIYAGVAAGSNADEISRNEDVSHLWESRERLVTLIGFAVLAFLPDTANVSNWQQGLRVTCMVILGFGAAACLFGLRFDIRLNLRRALSRYYIGTDSQTAASDQKASSLGFTGKQYAFLKLVALLLCVGLLLWIRQ